MTTHILESAASYITSMNRSYLIYKAGTWLARLFRVTSLLICTPTMQPERLVKTTLNHLFIAPIALFIPRRTRERIVSECLPPNWWDRSAPHYTQLQYKTCAGQYHCLLVQTWLTGTLFQIEKRTVNLTFATRSTIPVSKVVISVEEKPETFVNNK